MNLRMKIVVDIRNERRRSETEREMAIAIAGVEREISEQSSSHGKRFLSRVLLDSTHFTVFHKNKNTRIEENYKIKKKN